MQPTAVCIIALRSRYGKWIVKKYSSWKDINSRSRNLGLRIHNWGLRPDPPEGGMAAYGCYRSCAPILCSVYTNDSSTGILDIILMAAVGCYRSVAPIIYILQYPILNITNQIMPVLHRLIPVFYIFLTVIYWWGGLC